MEKIRCTGLASRQSALDGEEARRIDSIRESMALGSFSLLLATVDGYEIAIDAGSAAEPHRLSNFKLLKPI